MDNVSVRDAREFLNLSVERPRMHLLDEPTGYISAMGKSNLGHQMHYSVERLEAELADGGEPHVLQLLCEGDERDPQSWTLYADGLKCAHGTGEFARACFSRGGRRVHGRLPRSRARRRPPLPQQARLRPTAHRPQNSGGGGGRLSSSKSITTDNDR